MADKINAIDKRLIFTRALRFGVTGLAITALHVGVATVLIKTVLPLPALANGLAFIVATLMSYLINSLWSFSAPLHGKSLLRFLAVSAVGFCLAVAISGLVDWYGYHYLVGIAAVALGVPPVTFLLHNFWTFR